jgi:radical SAM superfamily enzyme YgiQ (UPF0313 family)
MNILFSTISAPEKSPFCTIEKRPPLGLGMLLSITRNAGHNVYFTDNYLTGKKEISLPFLLENNIDTIAIYCCTICFKEVLHVLQTLHQYREEGLWQGKIITGGPHAMVLPDSFPAYVDHIVIGEGDEVIVDIIEGRCKERIITPTRLKNLDNLPFQPWDIFTTLPYDWTCVWFEGQKVFTLNTSRGCPFHCTFCSACSIWGKRYSAMSAERIFHEIKYLYDTYHLDGVYFREDNFTINHNRVIDLCNLLIKNDIKISWACECGINTLNENIIQLMSQAGCKAVYLGVESGSQKMLDIMNKKITLKNIYHISKILKKYEINRYFSMIVGLPGENYLDFLKTRWMVSRLKPESVGYNIFVGLPGSDLYEELSKSKKYEYMDELGLYYMPGYDIKCEYFYGLDSKKLVDYEFQKRTCYDYCLLLEKKIHQHVHRIFPRIF